MKFRQQSQLLIQLPQVIPRFRDFASSRLHWGCGRPRPHIRPAKRGQSVCYHHPSRASSPRRLARTGTSTPPVWSSSVRLLLRHYTGVVDILVRTMSRRSAASRCMLNFRAHSVRMAFFTIHYSLDPLSPPYRIAPAGGHPHLRNLFRREID